MLQLLRRFCFVGYAINLAGVEQARQREMAGATVTRGIMGFGANSHIHTFKVMRLSEDLPVVVEIVDTCERLEQFLAEIDPEIREGLATLEKVQIRFYRANEEDSSPEGQD